MWCARLAQGAGGWLYVRWWLALCRVGHVTAGPLQHMPETHPPIASCDTLGPKRKSPHGRLLRLAHGTRDHGPAGHWALERPRRPFRKARRRRGQLALLGQRPPLQARWPTCASCQRRRLAFRNGRRGRSKTQCPAGPWPRVPCARRSKRPRGLFRFSPSVSHEAIGGCVSGMCCNGPAVTCPTRQRARQQRTQSQPPAP